MKTAALAVLINHKKDTNEISVFIFTNPTSLSLSRWQILKRSSRLKSKQV